MQNKSGHTHVEFSIPRKMLSKVGRYRIQMIVHSDRSSCEGSVWVLQKGTGAVIFDVDGTLTPSNSQVVAQLVLDAV